MYIYSFHTHIFHSEVICILSNRISLNKPVQLISMISQVLSSLLDFQYQRWFFTCWVDLNSKWTGLIHLGSDNTNVYVTLLHHYSYGAMPVILLFLSNFRSYIHKTLRIWLLKYELNKHNINIHVKVQRKKVQKASTLQK